MTASILPALRTRWGTIAALTFAACTAVLPAAAAEPAPPYNVLMIAVDDLNGWIGAMRGPAQTPNIDRLAGEGVLFTNAHAVVPACNPSRVALLTGQRPETTEQYTNAGNFRDLPGGRDRITLPQFLAARGYDTVAAGKIFHHPRGTGEEPAVLSDPDSWRTQRAGAVGTPGGERYKNAEGIPLWHDGVEFTHSYANTGIFWGPIPHAVEETGDWQTAEYCAEYLGQDHDGPFFLACGIFRPHNPLLAPQEFFERYPPESVELPPAPADDFDDIPAIAHTNWSSQMVAYMKASGEWPNAVRAYLASTSYADAMIGRLLDALRGSRYDGNTIVVLWGDHGWHLGDKERMEKFTLWRGATNAPLIVRMPGAQSGVSDASVSFLDIYPTLLSLMGLERPDFLEGHDFSGLLDDPSADWAHAAVTTYPAGNYSVKRGSWNYIRYEDGSEELYDYSQDAWEHRNLAQESKQAARIEAMRADLPETVASSRPEGIHPALDTGNSQWDGGAQNLTITQDVVFAPAGVTDLDEVFEDFYWNIPASVKKVIIAKDTRVTGHFRFTSAGQALVGEDRRTSTVFGTDTRAWARGPNRVEDEGTRCASNGLPAQVAGDDRVHDCEKWKYGAVSVTDDAPVDAVYTVRNLTIENMRTYAITAQKHRLHVDRVDIRNTRPAPDWHSNSDGIGGGPGTTITNTFIDTWDDSIKLYKDGFVVKDVTIVHNRNGAPFQLGWSDKPRTSHRLENVKVVQAGAAEGEKFNLALFSNSRGDVDATVLLRNVSARYAPHARLNKCGDDQPMPLVYLAGEGSRLKLVGKEKDDFHAVTPAAACGPGKATLKLGGEKKAL